jgi:hypothetical protein
MVVLRRASVLVAPAREGVVLGLHGQRLAPHRPAVRALERAIDGPRGAGAAGGEVDLVDDLLA